MAQKPDFLELLANLDNFPSVRMAQMALSSSQSQLNILSSPVKAELSATYTKTWGELNSTAVNKSLDSEDFGPISLTANFNVIPYGPIYDQIVKAKWNLQLAKNRLKDQKNTEIIKLFQNVTAVLVAKEKIALSEARLEQKQLQLQRLKTLLATGDANQSGLEQIQIQILENQNAVLSQKQNYQQALKSLAVLSGQNIDNLKNVTFELTSFSYKIEEVIENRTDVISARQKLLRAKLDAESRLRDNLPYGSVSSSYNHSTDSNQFNIAGSFSTKSFQPLLQTSYDPDFEPRAAVAGQISDSYNISLKMVIPLDAALPEALKLSETMIKEAETGYQQAQELAKLDILSKENSLMTAQSNLSLAYARLEQATNNLKINRARLEAGIISKLDLAAAENSLFEAQIGLMSAKNQSLVAKMQLAAALSIDLLEVIR